MLKRGQVTIFIILGIIIIAAIVFGISMRKQIAAAVSGTETSDALSFTEQSQMVKEHVEDCLKESLKVSVDSPFFTDRYLPLEQYKSELASLVKENTDNCINFNEFPVLEISKGNKFDVEIVLNEKMTQITAIAYLDIAMTKGEDKMRFSEFSASLSTVI
ncbi:MAG: hypothetical protein PHO02_06610 [Candidatus Nanoarchaeia archaeon]|nr:hypothetical protein [Candidatus Nanoarchaeia archaeon]